MSNLQKPGTLQIPTAEHREIDGRHYSIAPLMGTFALHHAPKYAKRITAIMAADGANSMWARGLQPKILHRASQFKATYDDENGKQIDALSAHISRSVSRTGAYVLAIGLFDTDKTDTRDPAYMLGYVEASLKTGHKNQMIDSYNRATRPLTVLPSIGHGVLLYPEFGINEEQLTDWAVQYALNTFRQEEIGERFADTLDFETCLENLQDTSWIEPYGDYEIIPSNRVSVLGETPVTVRFASLANIVKTT